MKKRIDVEKLLQWALREELPKGRATTTTPWELVMRFGMLGVRVDTSGPADGFGFVPGAPHEDAVTICAAVRALDASARMASEDDARNLFCGALSGLGEHVLSSLMVATFDLRSIVISHAVMAKRPPWQFDLPTPLPMSIEYRDALGAVRERLLVHGLDQDGCLVEVMPGRTKKARGVYDLDQLPRSPLNWSDPAPLHVGHSRAEYIAWHHALSTLAASLSGMLVDHEPLPPSALPRPWLEGEPVRQMYRVQGADVSEALPLAPKRPAAPRPFESKIERMAREGRSKVILKKKRNASAAGTTYNSVTPCG